MFSAIVPRIKKIAEKAMRLNIINVGIPLTTSVLYKFNLFKTRKIVLKDNKKTVNKKRTIDIEKLKVLPTPE